MDGVAERRLLERSEQLALLDEMLAGVMAGTGRVALIGGEAGIGKTSLVERFVEQHGTAVRTLWGACEALFTPRPLGPLHDIAQQARTPLRALLDGETNRAKLFAAVLEELAEGPKPTVVVFEDVHWADEATLDLITFLARRVHRVRCLFILTYRDDEVAGQHPLRLVLGDLPARDVTRIRLPLLSESAVAVLASGSRSKQTVEELYRVTGGNPFFLGELLVGAACEVPASVSDAVLAQVARRSPEARRLLELVAIAPLKIAWPVVEAVEAELSAGLEECLATGMLHQEEATVGYRHDLARQAVESSLSPSRRKALHAALLRVLLAGEIERTPLALIVHHAVFAEDGAHVLEFAPAAARQASAQWAHREAAAHYRRALGFAPQLAADEQKELRAVLLDGLSYECSLIGDMGEAIKAGEAALALWRDLQLKDRVGRKLRQLSRMYWNQGRTVEASYCSSEAIAVLETIEPSRELALAYANLAGQYMVTSNNAQTVVWGERALELAQQLNDVETICAALNSIGSSMLCSANAAGQASLDRSLALALEHGIEEQVVRAYVNVADIKLKQRAFAEAAEYLRVGMAYCAEHDMDSWIYSLRGIRAQLRLFHGDWAGAEEDATAILSASWLLLCDRISGLQVLGLLRARRGDPGAQPLLAELLIAARQTSEMQAISPACAARAEWQWLQGRTDLCRDEALPGYQLALEVNRPWYWGEAAVWLWRGSGLCEAPEGTPEPFALEIEGDWCNAAAAWERLGCPYEQALALMEGDEAAQRVSLEILERLGACAAADIVRRRLQGTGARGLPRGPRTTTRANPMNLTNRQLEVLRLMAEGLRNPEIAEELSTTPKTVEHHVSAVLAKLHARSRTEAAHIATELGMVHSPIPSTGKVGA